METQDIVEIGAKTPGGSERLVGITMTVVAALLALVTLMGHRLHTEEVVAQTKVADGWAYYQAKNGRFHMYAADAKLAQLIGPQGAPVADTWNKKADEERQQADEIRKANERLDEETQTIARRAAFFDAAEICLEVAIVLCSIALLTGQMVFWRVSFVGTVIGLAVVAFAFVRR